MEKISILIADDHVLLRQAWTLVLNRDVRYKVIAQCSNGEDAVKQARELNPDIVILDINLPGISGVETAKQITACSPASKILAASQHIQLEYVRRMLAAGAKGYITKSSEMEELFTALSEIQEGRKYICIEIKSRLAEQLLCKQVDRERIINLTKREKEIIDYTRQGLSSKEMAGVMNITTKTVEVHRYNILKKFGLKNSPALINYIHINGMAMAG